MPRRDWICAKVEASEPVSIGEVCGNHGTRVEIYPAIANRQMA